MGSPLPFLRPPGEYLQTRSLQGRALSGPLPLSCHSVHLLLTAAGEGTIMAGPVGATPPMFGGGEWPWLPPPAAARDGRRICHTAARAGAGGRLRP